MIKKFCKLTIFLWMLVMVPAFLHADTLPQTLRIGLETVYKDSASIALATSQQFNVGYMTDTTFFVEFTLGTPRLTIVPASQNYYTQGKTYTSFVEAQIAAQSAGTDTFVAWIAPSKYTLHTTNSQKGWSSAGVPTTAIVIQDATGKVTCLAYNNATKAAFQGDSLKYGVPTTQVGASRAYRGVVEIVKGQATGLTPVSVVDMEDYLYGVVPNEMVASWPIEALKAQAVAARSIATFQIDRYLSRGYNLVDSTLTQVYKGISSENERTNQAVDATAGEIITYNGRVAEALYFSTSGGMTEDAQNVWGNTVPYLAAVSDLYETQPEQAPWTRVITLDEVDTCLQKAGVDIGKAQGVRIVERTDSGRVLTLEILGSSGTHTLTRENIRTFFSASNEGSLKSRLFTLVGSTQESTATTTQTGLHILTDTQTVITQSLDLKAITRNGIESVSVPLCVDGENNGMVYTADILTSPTTDNSSSEILYGDLMVNGQGYGHGVGMSQSGARGMAEAGLDYETILKHYYQGIVIERY